MPSARSWRLRRGRASRRAGPYSFHATTERAAGRTRLSRPGRAGRSGKDSRRAGQRGVADRRPLVDGAAGTETLLRSRPGDGSERRRLQRRAGAVVLPTRLRKRLGCDGGELGPLVRVRRRNLHPLAHRPAAHRIEELSTLKGKRTLALDLIRELEDHL